MLEAKIEVLKGNLTTARQELDEAAQWRYEMDRLQAQLKAAGIETQPDIALSPVSAQTSSPAKPPGTSPYSNGSDPQQPSSAGQVSPSQVSPFQSAAMQEPGLSWMQNPEQSGFSQADAGLQSPEPSALFSASAVAQIQHQNAALKAELTQLSQREAAEEADVAGLQTQNRELIAEVEKLRANMGEVSLQSCTCSCLKPYIIRHINSLPTISIQHALLVKCIAYVGKSFIQLEQLQVIEPMCSMHASDCEYKCTMLFLLLNWCWLCTGVLCCCGVQARHKLADSKVAAGTAEKQRKQLETQLQQAEADKANVKAQLSDSQHSHEEELQSLRHTMQLISDEMRNAQAEYESKLKAAAAELSTVKADSEEKSEQLARQLGQSDFAVRQLRAELETASSVQSQTYQDSQQQDTQQLETQISSLTEELAALKTQHGSALSEHDSAQTEHASKLEQAQDNYTQLQQDIVSLQDQLHAAKQQYEQAEGKADRLKAALQKKSTGAEEMQTQFETKMSELQQQLEAQSAQMDSAADKAAVEAQIQHMTAKNDSLQQEVVDLRTDLDESRQQVCF